MAHFIQLESIKINIDNITFIEETPQAYLIYFCSGEYRKIDKQAAIRLKYIIDYIEKTYEPS